MDLGAWERRTAGIADPGDAYEDEYDYGYGYDDEEYHAEPEVDPAALAEYEESVFQSALSKIRSARTTGESNVQLTPEELEIYRARLLGPPAPATQPQAAPRIVSAPASIPVPMPVPPVAPPNSVVSGVEGSASGTSRPSKGERRKSWFSSKGKKDRTTAKKRERAASNASLGLGLGLGVQIPSGGRGEPPATAPGFVVPGPDGRMVLAPVGAYLSSRESGGQAQASVQQRRRSQPQPQPRRSSGGPPAGSQQPQPRPKTPPSSGVPGAFPTGSPQRSLFESPPSRPSQPQAQARPQARPASSSSSSRQSSLPGISSAQASPDWHHPHPYYQQQQHTPPDPRRSSAPQYPQQLYPHQLYPNLPAPPPHPLQPPQHHLHQPDFYLHPLQPLPAPQHLEPPLPMPAPPQPPQPQQPTKLIPFPTPQYTHPTLEPYRYQVAGQTIATSSALQLQTSSQPQVRRIVSGGSVAESVVGSTGGSVAGCTVGSRMGYTTMPRRVPVPGSVAEQGTSGSAAASGSASGSAGAGTGAETGAGAGKVNERKRRSGGRKGKG